MNYIILYRKYDGTITETFRTGNLEEALRSYNHQKEKLNSPSSISLCQELLKG